MKFCIHVLMIDYLIETLFNSAGDTLCKYPIFAWSHFNSLYLLLTFLSI
jgi:hypothetical protein